MKNRFMYNAFIIFGILQLISYSYSCSDHEDIVSTQYQPVVFTRQVYNIQPTYATCEGEVISDGGYEVTERGFCWGTSHNPVVIGSHVASGKGMGSFICNITGLTTNVTHYLRAYATNSKGTSYGQELTFIPLAKIGIIYQGGILAYILKEGDPGYKANEVHGLVVATADKNHNFIEATWSHNNNHLVTGAIATAFGTGMANTNTIVAAQGEGDYAAKICYDMDSGGFTDWYLPSKDELKKFGANYDEIGYDYLYYRMGVWSSSEIDKYNAYHLNFNPFSAFSWEKKEKIVVVCIRSF